MLFSVAVVLFSTILVIKVIMPDRIDTNLVLYLCIIVVIVTSQNLNKDAFIRGYCRLTDETKVSLLFAAKSFLLVWVLFAYTDGAAASFVGIDVDALHKAQVTRLNSVIAAMGSQIDLAPESTYLALSLMASYISFTVVKQSITFGYYFFFMTRAASKGNS